MGLVLKKLGIISDLSSSKTVQITSAIWENKGVIQCVYKISFDDLFYIGSTVNFKERVHRHFYNFRSADIYRKAAKAVMSAYQKCTTVKFEILELVQETTMLRDREKVHIVENLQNENLLNKHAFTNAVSGFNRQKQVVIRRNTDGTNKVYLSIAELSKDIKMHPNSVRAALKYGWKILGFRYDKIDVLGNIIPPIKRKNKIYKPKAGAGRYNRAVIKMGLDGELLQQFNNMKEAAGYMKSNASTMRSIISKSPRRYYKGFIWKYA